VADRCVAELAVCALRVDPAHHGREIDLGDRQAAEARHEMTATAAAIVVRVAVREAREERVKERREVRRIALVLDPDLTARDARLDLLHVALRERLGRLARGLVDPASVLAVADLLRRHDARRRPEIPAGVIWLESIGLSGGAVAPQHGRSPGVIGRRSSELNGLALRRLSRILAC